ncbi:MAG: hypothetical protein RL689_2400, partial [Planctomycetota bacterium]
MNHQASWSAQNGSVAGAAMQRRATPLDAASPPIRAAGGQAVTVLCVDDHAVLIDGLASCFAADGRVRLIGSLPTADRLTATVATLQPDIVLLDVELPGIDAFEAADRLRHADPTRRFAFLSGHLRSGSIAAAARSGAWGYF